MRLLFAAILAAVPLAAQSIVTARAGMIYMVEGPVTIDGKLVRIQPKTPPPQVQQGQILNTPRGHAEMLLGQDAVLWTDNNTQVRLDDTNVDAPRISLLSGSTILEIKSTRAERHIFVDLGNQTAEIGSAGIYRFDRNPDKFRVWSGALTLQGPPGALAAGQSAEQGRRDVFNKRDMDELHYFAAYRSLVLESEAGHFEHWKKKEGDLMMRGAAEFKHSGFDLEFPLPAASTRAKYLAAAEAGLVNYIDGSIVYFGRRPNLPFRAGRSTLETNAGRVEVFLGLGITARLNDHTKLLILETRSATPSVALESGELIVEVARSAENTFLTLRLGDSVTDLHKAGLYRFDVVSSSLRVYGGEATTHFGGAIIRAGHAQRIDLQNAHAAVNFDTNYHDDFFHWSGRRSLQLFGSSSSFMADWEPQVQPGLVKHKQYGESATMTRSFGKAPAQQQKQEPQFQMPRPIGEQQIERQFENHSPNK